MKCKQIHLISCKNLSVPEALQRNQTCLHAPLMVARHGQRPDNRKIPVNFQKICFFFISFVFSFKFSLLNFLIFICFFLFWFSGNRIYIYKICPHPDEYQITKSIIFLICSEIIKNIKLPGHLVDKHNFFDCIIDLRSIVNNY